MRQVESWALRVGNRGDVREPRALIRGGVQAIVDLALEETPIASGRELIICRFPLMNGAGNPANMVRAAVETVAGLVRARVATLVVCSAGMSRSPAVAAGALATVTGKSARECLELVVKGAPADVSPGIWGGVLAAVALGR